MEEIHLVLTPDDLATINRALCTPDYLARAGLIAKINQQLQPPLPQNPPFKGPYANQRPEEASGHVPTA